MTEKILELRDVHKAFDQPVLQGVSLAVGRCEVVTILGESGTGKSVLLRLIMGLLRPDRGQILLAGKDLVTLNEEELLKVRPRMGMLFQGSALFDSLTVAENVAFPLWEHTDLTERQITIRVQELLSLVGLEGIEGRYPVQLSGGMKKRVALARAIALQPEIVLYDEPTTGLDPQNVERINSLIMDLQRRFCLTAIVVTHDLRSALEISDRLALLHQGRIIFEGSPGRFYGSDLPEVREFLGTTDLLDRRRAWDAV